MNIGFLSNQLDIRGTGNALYNYAHYNEELMGHKSHIYTFSSGRHDKDAYLAFEKRFGKINFISSGFAKLDVLYHIKSGYRDGFTPNLPYLVHSVFDNDPHGDVYATISPWMGARFNLPVVPHMVDIFPTDDNLRDQLGIPTGAVVFGRYGGADSFDISWVWDTIADLIEENNNVYFVFMNTNPPQHTYIAISPNVIFLPSTVDPYTKRLFINTCDAMIHARSRGETFGIAVGEFAVAGKPIITYENSAEKAHLQELGHFALTYTDQNSLLKQFEKVIRGPLVSWGYGQYTPENVMKKFSEVFLSNV
jgi:hypothetical protein